MHTYTHTHIHTYLHTYTHTHIHTYTHTHIHTNTHTHIHTYTIIYNYTHIHIYTYTYIHTYIHTFIHSYIHTLIHTCIHTYIDPSMHACIHIEYNMHIYIYVYIYNYLLCTQISYRFRDRLKSPCSDLQSWSLSLSSQVVLKDWDQLQGNGSGNSWGTHGKLMGKPDKNLDDCMLVWNYWEHVLFFDWCMKSHLA